MDVHVVERPRQSLNMKLPLTLIIVLKSGRTSSHHGGALKPQSPDTIPEAEQVLIEIIRRIPVWKRLAQVASLYDSCRLLALADLRKACPEADERELRRRLAARSLAPEVVAQVYGTWLE